MEQSKLKIKNMVCARCVRVVKEDLKKLNLEIKDIKLGEVTVLEELDMNKLNSIKQVIEKSGFELIDDRKSELIESIKNIIIKTIHHEDLSERKTVWSELLNNSLHLEYKYLSQLFSSVEGVTIEHFIILHKVEKAKELLVYNQLTLSEISWKLGYSSVAHLSSQFKKVTGMTPSNFKSIRLKKENFLIKCKSCNIS